MKRQNCIHLSCYCLLIIIIVLFASASCSGVDSTKSKSSSTLPEAFKGNFIIRLYSVNPGKDTAFIKHLEECYVPIWRQLYEEEILASISVFELIQIETTIPETPPWRFLLLAELDYQASPEDFLNAEYSSTFQSPSDNSFFTVLRVELMTCTPASCYKMPELSYPDASAGIEYLLEFIDVENSPSYLSKYRDLMKTYLGPANGVLVKEGILHCFIALETTDVLHETIEAPGWNQLHVSDDWDVAKDVDWDTIYIDLFRREFSCELDSLSAEFPPFGEHCTEYSEKLVPSLCIR